MWVLSEVWASSEESTLTCAQAMADIAKDRAGKQEKESDDSTVGRGAAQAFTMPQGS